MRSYMGRHLNRMSCLCGPRTDVKGPGSLVTGGMKGGGTGGGCV